MKTAIIAALVSLAAAQWDHSSAWGAPAESWTTGWGSSAGWASSTAEWTSAAPVSTWASTPEAASTYAWSTPTPAPVSTYASSAAPAPAVYTGAANKEKAVGAGVAAVAGLAMLL
jgi:hypothetical protein